jgi:hypothetical protein
MRRLILEAIESPLDSMGIGFAARIDRAPSGIYAMTLAVETRNMNLESRNGEWIGKTYLTVIQHAADGKILEQSLKTIDLRLKDADVKAAAQQGLKLALAVKPVANVKSLRVVVADPASGSIGSLRIPL